MIDPCLDVVVITDVQDIPKTVCNRIQAKKIIQRHHIFMIDYDYDYILNETERWEKIEFERTVICNIDEE